MMRPRSAATRFIQAAKRALVARQADAAKQRGVEVDPSLRLGSSPLSLMGGTGDGLSGYHDEVLHGLKRLARGASGVRRVAGVPALSGILEPLGFHSSVRCLPPHLHAARATATCPAC